MLRSSTNLLHMNSRSTVINRAPSTMEKKRVRTGVCHYGPTNTFFVSSPIGEIKIVSCPKGLHQLTQGSNLTDKDFKPDLRCTVKLLSQLYPDNGYTYLQALQCISWLQSFFNRDTNSTEPALCPSISSDDSFRGKVRSTLMKEAPFGTTLSYKQLSVAAGNSNGARAVGQAMANNPVMLLVPCHRVIKSDGGSGNYAGGRRNTVKEWLLKFEKGEL